MMPRNFLIEGPSGIGKSRLSNRIGQVGAHSILHFRPPDLSIHEASTTERAHAFSTMFRLLAEADAKGIVFASAHLSEVVYGPLCRAYSGDYVYALETAYHVETLRHVRLVLLVEQRERAVRDRSDDVLESWERQALEQRLFMEAFEKSRVLDKRVVGVTDPSGAPRSMNAIMLDAVV